MEYKTITIYELMGLIKDNKVPKKIKWENNIYIFNGQSYWDEEKENNLFQNITKYYSDAIFPTEKVEILPEENDEWEDIEEIEQIISSKAVYDSWEDITKDIQLIVTTIDDLVISFNQLIKNQTYLKEKLDNNTYFKSKVEFTDYIDEYLTEKLEEK